MLWYQYLLLPFSILYDAITRFRNLLYDRGWQPSVSFEPQVWVVGNLRVGGTGKTPMVEYLIRYFDQKGMGLATLSRGYGRKTKGFRLAEEQDTPTTLGDEPYLFFRKYGKKVQVAVGEERALAIPFILAERPDTSLILLDDAFQHRSVRASTNLLLTTFQQPFFQDLVLPAGRLRESRHGAARANAVIVTKCPGSISAHQKAAYRQQIARYTDAPVFFSSIQYGALQSQHGTAPNDQEKVIGVAGLANPALFFEVLDQQYTVMEKLSFADHHRYQKKDLEKMEMLMKRHQASLITTEKDWVKLERRVDFPIHYLPIKTEMLETNQFHQWLEERIH
jgi:tetraacyldisaccharide 4'-kinase